MSLTQGFYDDDSRLMQQDDYSVVSSFVLKYKYLTLFLFPKPRYIDLSDTLSKILKAADGDAIANLHVEGANSETNDACLTCMGCLPAFGTFGLLNPCEVVATVTGDVVKLKGHGSRKQGLLLRDNDGRKLAVVLRRFGSCDTAFR